MQVADTAFPPPVEPGRNWNHYGRQRRSKFDDSAQIAAAQHQTCCAYSKRQYG